MEENSRKVALVVGAIAAAAGVAVATYLYFGSNKRQRGVDRMKNVSDLLSDCYVKIKELQRTLSDHAPALEPTQ